VISMSRYISDRRNNAIALCLSLLYCNASMILTQSVMILTPLPVSSCVPDSTPVTAVPSPDVTSPTPSPPHPSPPLPTQETPAQSTCPLIHSSKPIHPFFKTLSSRPRFLTKHFTKNFLSSSPVCGCQRFPVLASKLPPTTGSPIKPLHPALSHLCLVCARSLTNKEYAGGRLEHLWSRDLENEWSAHYMRFYSPEEEAHFREVEPLDDYFQRTQFIFTRVWPLLKEMGGPILLPRQSADSDSEEEEEKEPAECEESEESEEDALVGALFDDSCSAHDSECDEDEDEGEVEDDTWASM